MDNISVLSFNKLKTYDKNMKNVINRMSNEPNDIRQGLGINPISMIVFKNNFFLLRDINHVNEYIGYCVMSKYSNNEGWYIEIDEFEIFHEYRKLGYGKIFALHITNLDNLKNIYKTTLTTFQKVVPNLLNHLHFCDAKK